jgi:hypothetical protein
MILCACVVMLGVSLDVRRRRRSRPPAAPPAAAPLAQGEDGLPGQDEGFRFIDVLARRELQGNMVAHYVNEGRDSYAVREEGGLVLIDQPALVPAHWDYDIHGLALGRTRLAGDFDADVVLDLERSRFSPRRGDPARYSWFTLETMFAGEGHPSVRVLFAPAGKGAPHGAVWNGQDGRAFALPRPSRSLAFHVRRRADWLTVSAASEQGPLGRVLDRQAPEVRRPIRQINLYVQVYRPKGDSTTAPWPAPGRDVYALKAFTLACADPKGCAVRVR